MGEKIQKRILNSLKPYDNIVGKYRNSIFSVFFDSYVKKVNRNKNHEIISLSLFINNASHLLKTDNIEYIHTKEKIENFIKEESKDMKYLILNQRIQKSNNKKTNSIKTIGVVINDIVLNNTKSKKNHKTYDFKYTEYTTNNRSIQFKNFKTANFYNIKKYMYIKQLTKQQKANLFKADNINSKTPIIIIFRNQTTSTGYYVSFDNFYIHTKSSLQNQECDKVLYNDIFAIHKATYNIDQKYNTLYRVIQQYINRNSKIIIPKELIKIISNFLYDKLGEDLKKFHDLSTVNRIKILNELKKYLCNQTIKAIKIKTINNNWTCIANYIERKTNYISLEDIFLFKNIGIDNIVNYSTTLYLSNIKEIDYLTI